MFTFGRAPFYGSAAGMHSGSPIIGISADEGSGGYYLTGADGGVFAFGDARFLGSEGGPRLNAPIVGMDETF